MFARELKQRQRAVMGAMAREAEFRALAEQSGDLIVRFDGGGRRTYASPAAQKLLGRSPAELLGRPLGDLAHPDDAPTLREAIARVLRGEAESATITFRASHADGRWIWLEGVAQAIRHEQSSAPDGVVEVLRDVTERKKAEEKFHNSARTDALTGVYNRGAIDACIAEEFDVAARDSSAISLLFIDVDYFKKYNDQYGHQAGDACLRTVAGAIRAAARADVDMVGRYGGEEFVVILPHADEAVADAVAERIRSSIEGLGIPHEASSLANRVVTVSIGIATARPTQGSLASTEAESLIRAADGGLYLAKRLGRNRAEAVMEPATALR